VIVLLSLLGVLKTAVQNRHFNYQLPITNYRSLLTAPSFPALLLLLWFLLVYAGLVAFMLKTPAAQGRLLFPALLPIALALVYGLTRWRWRGIFGLVPLAALLTTLYCCFFVIRPAYALPTTLAELPADVAPMHLEIGNGLLLRGVTVETDTAVPGDTVWLTLYWQAEPVPSAPPERVLELFGRDLALLGNAHSYHVRGQYPANLWPEAAIVPERVGIRLSETLAAPVLAPAFVRLAVESATGSRIADIKIEPAAWPTAPAEVLAQIGESIQLTAVSLSQNSVKPGESITIDVTWRVTQAPGTDLTTLIHLGQAGQPPLATGDNQPLQGQYPSRVWEAAEVIHDQYTLTVPADLADGRYPLWLGMYDSETIVRWPLTAVGQRLPNDVLQIGEIEVVE
jgi:hypothetical protein